MERRAASLSVRKSFVRSWVSVLPVWLALVVVPPVLLSAQESADSLRTAARNQLADHWELGEVSRTALTELTERAAAERSADADVTYAIGLSQLRQLQYRDAVASFAKAQSEAPGDPEILLALVWGEVLTRQSRQATVRLAELAKAISESAADDPARRTHALDLLGAVDGYLGLPTGQSVDSRELARQRRLIEERLGEEDRATWLAARDQVERLHDSLTADKEVEREIATDEARKERDRLLESLAEERTRLSERETAIVPQLDRLREQLAATLSELQQRDTPLASEWAQAAARIRSIESRIVTVEFDIVRLNRLAAIERDPFLRSRWFFEAGRLRLVLDDLFDERAATAAYADSIAVQRSNLQNEYAARRGEIDRQLAPLDTELKQLRRQMTINEGRTRRESGPVRVVAGRSQAYGQRARTLSTYAEFPLDAERARMIIRLTGERSDASEATEPAGRLSEEPSDSLILDGRDKD